MPKLPQSFHSKLTYMKCIYEIKCNDTSGVRSPLRRAWSVQYVLAPLSVTMQPAHLVVTFTTSRACNSGLCALVHVHFVEVRLSPFLRTFGQCIRHG